MTVFFSMKIRIVYDNCSAREELRTGWGFSALIETSDTPPILFDTGDNGVDLLYNMKRLDIDPAGIGTIVISHAHGDHTGGLRDILEINTDASIYLPASVSARIKGRDIVPVSEPVYISKSVISTGELKGIEQSLLVRTGKGIVVVTGCSHPGVGTIIDTASRYGEVYGIIGGLHGFNEFSRLYSMSLICPCHCTRHKVEISELFPSQYVPCGAGLEIEL